ncbi:MAG: hypothetical protein IMY72_09970 [Bacteroidetes bacterium]|nr:hypothetical protein [Bacteroidota bacterium]
MKKLLLYFIFCIFFSSSLQSQIIADKNIEKIYGIKVKQFNEFLNRFNYKTDFKGNLIDSVFLSKISRAYYLKMLFNEEDTRIESKNTDYLNRINEFITDVTTSEIFMNKYSDRIIAEVKSNINYKGKKKEVYIFLNQEIVEPDMLKWVISDVDADFLYEIKIDTTNRFLSPSSNETNFISLRRALKEKDFAYQYAHKDFNIDLLSIFFYEIKTGNIKVNQVNEITYHIFDIPGWYITVREFNRDTENSGWLIEDLKKNSEK